MYAKEIREKTGISRDTLRHYVQMQLLVPKKDPKNGYLSYNKKDLETLFFILRAKNLGFSLEEIRMIEQRIVQAPCPHQSILPDLHKNLLSVEEKIRDLKVIQNSLQTIIQTFERKNCAKKPSSFVL